MAASVLVFDIETIPDVAGLRALRGAHAALSDAEVFAAEQAERKAGGKSDMLPLYLQRVLVISCVFRNAKGVTVQSFVDRSGNEEGAVIQTFFEKIEKHQPQLVSWNGGGFDLPVLHYRGLRHGVVADKYWDLGEDDREYKWNNYISRYHTRHTDLMDLLALYQPRASVPLDELAKLCGYPGKLGMDGSAVWGAWLSGGIDDIRDYCETDVVNTYLVFLRFQRLRGVLAPAEHDAECAFVKVALGALPQPHWRLFLDAWKG